MMNPKGAPSCGIIAYQPRLPAGALSESSEARPSQAPASARPCPMRQIESSTTAATPIWPCAGRKLIAAVEEPSSSSAIVIFTPRPCSRPIHMKSTEPKGRAMKASEKIAKE